MAIMDANYVEGIDDATKSRLFDKMVEMKRFDKPEYFAELARRAITSGLEGIPINDTEWQEIGQYILGTPLSHREVGHVLRDIGSGYEIPDEMIGAPFEADEKLVQDYLRSITKEAVLGRFSRYIETRAIIDEKSRTAKMDDDAERFLRYITMKKSEGTTTGSR